VEEEILEAPAARDGAVDIQVDPPVIVPVAPGAAVVAVVDCQPERGRHINELPAVDIPVEAVRPIVGAEDVDIAVIVVVGERWADAPEQRRTQGPSPVSTPSSLAASVNRLPSLRKRPLASPSMFAT